MRFAVIGLHSRFSSLAFHEAFAKACMKALADTSFLQTFSIVLLQTCNRSEIYFSAEDLAEAHSTLLGILREELKEGFEQHVYSLFGLDCFYHLAGVASGLDSIIVGESDIQRQIKKAYEAASLSHNLNAFTHFLFQKSLKISKEMRTLRSFPKNGSTLEKVILRKIKESGYDNPSILLIGNSDINRKIATCLAQHHLPPKALITRSVSQLSEVFKGVDILGWEERAQWTEFDIIIAATYNGIYDGEYAISSNLYPDDLWKKRMLFDLSVPRCIDPALERFAHTQLLNMEDLNRFLEEEKLLFKKEVELVRDQLRAAIERQHDVFEKKNQRAEWVCIA